MKKLLLAFLLLGSSLAVMAEPTRFYFSVIQDLQTQEIKFSYGGFVSLDIDRNIIGIVTSEWKAYYIIENITSGSVMIDNDSLFITVRGTGDKKLYSFIISSYKNSERWVFSDGKNYNIEFIP